MRKFLAVMLLVVLAAMVGTGCSKTEVPVTPDELPGASNGPDYGGTIRLTLADTPPGVFNPAFSTAVTDNTINSRVYATLVRLDTLGNPEPCLAERWTYSEDGKVLTFKIREDAFFHDGVQLTAHDVEFTFKLLAHPDYAGPRGIFVNYLVGYDEYRSGATDVFTGIKVIDDFNISFTTKAVNVKQMDDRSFSGILPKHILGDVAVANLVNHPFNSAPIGAGPFRFKSMATDQYVILEANQDYFEGRPYADELLYLIRDAESALVEMELGQLDFIGISPEDSELVQEWAHVNMLLTPTTQYNLFSFNLQDPRFDLLTRKAFAHAINRQGMVDDVMYGTTAVIDSPISPASWAYHDSLHHYDYNPDLARKFLADAGWEPGPDGILTRNGDRLEMDFPVPVGTRFVKMGTIIQQNLAAIGAKVNMTVIDVPVWLQNIAGRPKPYTADQFDITIIQIGFGGDPDLSAMFHTTGGFNFGGYYNEENDRLLEAALTVIDRAERRALYLQWQEHVNEQLPIVPLFHGAANMAMHTRLQDVMDSNGLPQRNELWWIPKGLQ